MWERPVSGERMGVERGDAAGGGQDRQYSSDSEAMERILSSIPSGLCVYRLDEGRILPVFHNPAFYEILGYSDEHISQVQRETALLGVHQEDVPGLKEKLRTLSADCTALQHTCRIFNDKRGEYRWIHAEGSVKRQKDGVVLIYVVFSDVTEQKELEKELANANEKMQDIINAIPGGVAIYKVTDIFETVYFSDGVPELSGYTTEEYRSLVKKDAAEMTYREDTPMVLEKAAEVIQSRGSSEFEFRKQHRDGHIVWVRVQIKWIGEEDGCPLLHCVFHNISALKESQLEMEHLVNSIPGGIASYRFAGTGLKADFLSDGVIELTGYTREEYEEMIRENSLDLVYEADRQRVFVTLRAVMENGDARDVACRIHHKNGGLIWVHLNSRRIGPKSENAKLYVVYTGMSAETRLFQSIANETADGIYVIDRENYDLLYVNESKCLFLKDANCVGQKCYAALHGRDRPCEFCTLTGNEPNGEEHMMAVKESDRFFSTRFRETDWNGIPAYIKYVRDVTDEVSARKEIERLERYFQTLVKNLPGGVGVISYERDGSMRPEFLSDGFAAMTGMTLEEAWELYRDNAMNGVHPDDRDEVSRRMAAYLESGDSHCEIVYRLKKGRDDYLWVKNTLSLIQNEGGEMRIYAVYHDMTGEREEKEELRRQYRELIRRHYQSPDPDALIIGHCNITQNRILEIVDRTNSGLLQTFGSVREDFFAGIGSLVVDEAERRSFLNTYLNAPTMAAFERNDTELIQRCYIKLPQEERGRYVQFNVNLVETPDTGDITGILKVTDVTEQIISDRILHQLSLASCDLVVDVDLQRDRTTVLSSARSAGDVPAKRCGSHSEAVDYMLREQVVPKDKKNTAKMLNQDYMLDRLTREGSYSFSYSIVSEKGDVLTKNLTIYAADLRLGRVCLARTDITNSLREQQSLLNMMAYTFELMGFVDIRSGRLTMYTRQTVLENLPPYTMKNYDASVARLAGYYKLDDQAAGVEESFRLETMMRRLKERPSGYDFVFPYCSEDQPRYKQVNVLWGDENHRTICLVRADVTDMISSERRTKKALEDALALAEEASRAKGDFLASMSHDIRTPMNAIVGMTTLAEAHLDQRDRVKDCLKKINISSRHLLSLINDILDMNKIERSQIALNHIKVFLPELLEQLSAIIAPQAGDQGLIFSARTADISHRCFYGDPLRISQILINILSNAVKFTPEGGRVDFLTEELPPLNGQGRVRYRFTVSDTGVGMQEEFLAHIFDPFTRDKNTSWVEGTGLGLSIMKGLVDLMGGRVTVESHIHRGTTFRVELECEAVPKGEDAEGCSELAASEGDNILSGRCFLAAEDNPLNAEILSELLMMHGARTVVRTDGAQAVRAFLDAAPGTYDAVLMDIQMPVMNGYEAARAIRSAQRDDAAAVPIIAMTANAFSEDIRAALEAGMNAHVSKPIDMVILRNTLNQVLTGADK